MVGNIAGASLNTTGIYSALFTPLTDTDSLNIDALKRLVRYELQRGVEGFYCCGSSGEALLLEKTERMKVAEVVAHEVARRVPVVVHTGALSTRDAIVLSRHAQDVGACGVSLIPPIYYQYKEQEVVQYYKDVMQAIDLGVIVYNIPQFTRIAFSQNHVLLEDSQVVGIKHTSLDLYQLNRIAQKHPEKVLFNGFDEIWLYSLAAGATATIGTMANICPLLFKEIRSTFEAGNMPQAQKLQSTLNQFVETLVSINIFPAAKYCMSVLGIDSGACRKPFDTLSEQEKKSIEQALKKIQAYL